jgi:WD40 repeat protein
LKWCGGDVNKLFTAGIGLEDCKIHAYDLTTLKEINVKEDIIETDDSLKPEDKRHKLAITDLLPIPEMNCIASCSLDSTIILWYMRDLTFKSKHMLHSKADDFKIKEVRDKELKTKLM